jgi:hypothetical protein
MSRERGKVLSFGPFELSIGNRRLERRLLLFDYIDGGVVTECGTKKNVEELASLNLRQRVLSGALAPSLEDR